MVRPSTRKPISVPQTGAPQMKARVPSIGSTIHSKRPAERLSAISSPTMAWFGKRAAITSRMTRSASRSPSVTGSKPDLVFVVDVEPESGSAAGSRARRLRPPRAGLRGLACGIEPAEVLICHLRQRSCWAVPQLRRELRETLHSRPVEASDKPGQSTILALPLISFCATTRRRDAVHSGVRRLICLPGQSAQFDAKGA